MLGEVARAVTEATAGYEAYDVATARAATDKLLWTFADDWLELAKARFWNEAETLSADFASGQAAMTETLGALLGLYAPLLPYVTDALYQQLFRPAGLDAADADGAPSIHVSAWPVAQTVEPVEGIDVVLAVLRAARAYRTEQRLPQSAELDTFAVDLPDPGREELLPALHAAARAREVIFLRQ
jgi:valyl-tRNA synthetase